MRRGLKLGNLDMEVLGCEDESGRNMAGFYKMMYLLLAVLKPEALLQHKYPISNMDLTEASCEEKW